ncbi:MAG: hypothetical protein WD024_03865 [Bacillota bacterium]
MSHTYVDNGTYLVALSLIDADGYAYGDSFAVTVSNVAPTVKLSKSWINSRGWVGVTGSFTDPGEDTWTATIDFGDGSGPLSLTLKDSCSMGELLPSMMILGCAPPALVFERAHTPTIERY